MRRARGHPVGRGFTLLEVVLAMGILVLVTSMTYWFYSSSLDTRRAATEVDQRQQLVRLVLDRMAAEIRQTSLTATLGQGSIRGEPERLTMVTHRLPGRSVAEDYLYDDELPAQEYDLVSVDYHVVRHPEAQDAEGWDLPLGLARVERRMPYLPPQEELLSSTEEATGDETSGGDTEGELTGELEELLAGDSAATESDTKTLEDVDWDALYAPDIVYLRFCYFDGLRWWDTWDVQSENPLPQIVQVTIGFEPRAPLGEGLGYDQAIEEFCTCQNEDEGAEECLPLAADLYQITVRVPQADTFFRSRVARETQALAEELAGEAAQETEDGGTTP